MERGICSSQTVSFSTSTYTGVRGGELREPERELKSLNDNAVIDEVMRISAGCHGGEGKV